MDKCRDELITEALAILEDYTNIDMTIIDAMIRGVFDCFHCANGRVLGLTRPVVECLQFSRMKEPWHFCANYQERKDQA